MGVDEDIQNIYYSIYNINITLANIDQNLAGALNGMNFGLGVFDHHVNMVVQTVNDVQTNIVSTTQMFPNQWLYLIVLLFVIFLLMGLAGYLLLYIVRYLMNRQQKIDDYRMWYLKNVMKQKFKDEDANYYDEEEYVANGDMTSGYSDTPPPTYSEYVHTADIYANYHDEIEAQRARQQQQPRRNQEWSTLI